MSNLRDNNGRFVSTGHRWKDFMEKYEVVKNWLGHRSEGTGKQYGMKLLHFCEANAMAPREFQDMDRFKARDMVWECIQPFIQESPSKAKNYRAALKSFYRNKDGVTLPFDSRRGGKHYFNTKRRKKAAKELIPTKPEMYRITDATTNIRDKAIFLTLFQSGIRVGALCNLKFKHVKKQLYGAKEPKIPLRLRITDQIDTKLRGYQIDFYDTFLQGEAVEALKAYCDHTHNDEKDDVPLFITKIDTPMNGQAVWGVLKTCVKRAGLDPERIWTHTIRRCFKRVVRTAMIDPDFKEAIMGHVLEGSRENYFSRYRPQDIEENYMKIDFNREISKSETETLKNQLREERKKILTLEKKVAQTQLMFKKMMSTVLGSEVELRFKEAKEEGKNKIKLTLGLSERDLKKLRSRAREVQKKEKTEPKLQYIDVVKVDKHDIETVVKLIKKGYEMTFENEKHAVFTKK